MSEVVDGRGPDPRHAVYRRAVGDDRFKDGAVERLVEAGQQRRTPIRAQRGQCADQRIGTPIRDASDDQVSCRGDAGDGVAMRDVAAISVRGNAPMPISLPPSPTAIVSHGPAAKRSSRGRCMR